MSLFFEGQELEETKETQEMTRQLLDELATYQSLNIIVRST